LDVPALLHDLNTNEAASNPFTNAEILQLQRRLVLTAAHCVGPSLNSSFLPLDPSVYEYPFDDPVVRPRVGFRFDIMYSPGRIRFGDVKASANCAFDLPDRVTIDFQSTTSFPMFFGDTLGIGERIAPFQTGKVLQKSDLKHDYALLLLDHAVPPAIVSPTRLIRIARTHAGSFNAQETKPLSPLTLAGYGIPPGGDPAKGFLGNPNTFVNTSFSNRTLTPITISTINADFIQAHSTISTGAGASCFGDSGGAWTKRNDDDGRDYAYGITTYGINDLCRGQEGGVRVGTPDMMSWTEQAVHAYLSGGLALSQQVRTP
jgi:hypothetical protein